MASCAPRGLAAPIQGRGRGAEDGAEDRPNAELEAINGGGRGA